MLKCWLIHIELSGMPFMISTMLLASTLEEILANNFTKAFPFIFQILTVYVQAYSSHLSYYKNLRL